MEALIWSLILIVSTWILKRFWWDRLKEADEDWSAISSTSQLTKVKKEIV
ncbi:hypothetical protein [Mycovorax composti]